MYVSIYSCSLIGPWHVVSNGTMAEAAEDLTQLLKESSCLKYTDSDFYSQDKRKECSHALEATNMLARRILFMLCTSGMAVLMEYTLLRSVYSHNTLP